MNGKSVTEKFEVSITEGGIRTVCSFGFTALVVNPMWSRRTGNDLSTSWLGQTKILRDSSIVSRFENMSTSILPSFAPLQGRNQYQKTAELLQTLSSITEPESLFNISFKTMPVTLSISTSSENLYAFAKSAAHVTIRPNFSSVKTKDANEITKMALNPDRGWMITVLIPVIIVLFIGTLIVLVCLWKKQNRRKRARKWNSNAENSLSWFEAFELPHAVGNSNVMNDFNEPADFSIPMGPLCINNFAFESYDATTEDSMMERYSMKNKHRKDFHNPRRRSDVHPTEQVFSRTVDTDKQKSNQALKNTHFITGADFDNSNSHFKLTSSFK
ncbi:uncharacterized protein LOC135689331 isoform X2 [Rhopilema esculentum]